MQQKIYGYQMEGLRTNVCEDFVAKEDSTAAPEGLESVHEVEA